MERLKATGAPALVAFTSDHGENLFDTAARMRGHGVPGTTRYEVEVPFAVWTSPAFRAERPAVTAALVQNRRQPVTTADLFYGLADVIGARWPGADSTRSVFSPAYQPGPRRVFTPTYDVVDAETILSGTG